MEIKEYIIVVRLKIPVDDLATASREISIEWFKYFSIVEFHKWPSRTKEKSSIAQVNNKVRLQKMPDRKHFVLLNLYFMWRYTPILANPKLFSVYERASASAITRLRSQQPITSTRATANEKQPCITAGFRCKQYTKSNLKITFCK